MIWQTSRFTIDLSRPRVMGIVNVTPDSFSDGGRHTSLGSAVAHCEALLAEGADILDIGGESTRPGAAAPGIDEELRRVVPLVREAVKLGAPISVDTSRPEVMQQALELGADIVNDVRSLSRPGALDLVRAFERAGVCLMHLRGEPDTMAGMAHYGDVVAEVAQTLNERAAQLIRSGIAAERIVLDPGIGFAKTAEHNLELLARQRELVAALSRPTLVGWSRKGTLGRVTARTIDDRLSASVAAALLAVDRGARLVRVHDVAATVDALKVWQATVPVGPGPNKSTQAP